MTAIPLKIVESGGALYKGKFKQNTNKSILGAIDIESEEPFLAGTPEQVPQAAQNKQRWSGG